MNKFRNASIILVISLLFASCGGSNDEATDENVDSVKKSEQSLVDTIAEQDTTKKADAMTK